ncbi:MAG TPA: efflux RND transporter periplasmic adaptor subunit, partial [Burkholderiaceae bacterium]|nr:efflux RND transporter periplasmic adaptor subunit [Burkholderiaceae bacterium]
MKRRPISRRALAMTLVLTALLALFAWVVMRSGPLAPVPVTTTTVELAAVAPALYGIGTVESRYTYRIGPTQAGRLGRLLVDVGERVQAGQLLGEMDPVDLDQRAEAQRAALDRARAGVSAAEAQVADLSSRRQYAETQARRYERLLQARSASEEAVEARRHEQRLAEAGLLAARANLDGARRELERARADLDGALRQRANMRLIAPVDGLVAARDADPGTSLVAGQPAVKVIDPASLWINARFDQLRAASLRDGLPARIVLRSRDG